MIVFGAIVPHPPESIPGIGTKEDQKKIQKTLKAFEQLRVDLEKAKPDTIVIISPHCKLEAYSFSVNSDDQLRGSFANFGLDDAYMFENDLGIANKIAYGANMNDISAHMHANFLDHGALIPLFHLTKNIHPKIVHLAFSLMGYPIHYRYGEIINIVCQRQSKSRIAIIASGGLSHRLSNSSPAGKSPEAEEFDRNIIHFLGENDLASLMGISENLTREVEECGLRSIIILLGALRARAYKFKLLSYESPSGIGYLTARLL